MNWFRRLFKSRAKGPEPFTPEAIRFWDSIPAEMQARIVGSVWCVRCKSRTGVPMKDYSGQMEAGDLILRGRCALCGGKVSRVVEHE